MGSAFSFSPLAALDLCAALALHSSQAASATLFADLQRAQMWQGEDGEFRLTVGWILGHPARATLSPPIDLLVAANDWSRAGTKDITWQTQ